MNKKTEWKKDCTCRICKIESPAEILRNVLSKYISERSLIRVYNNRKSLGENKDIKTCLLEVEVVV